MTLRLPIPGVIALAACVLAGCGGDDSKKGAAPTPVPTPTTRPLEVQAVRTLPLDTPRAEVERMFGPPAKPDFVDRKIKRGEPKGFDCIYYGLEGKGGPERNYTQLCFGQRNTLDSKLEITNADDDPGAGSAAARGVPPS